MAPPAVKRRKLEHSDSEQDSDGSFADFADNVSVADDISEGSDDSRHDLADMQDDDDDDDMGDNVEENSEEETVSHQSPKPKSTAKVANAQKPPKRPASSPHDGMYTSDAFKSNIFKLQVDELLDQVKLKYGHKEAPAENAMRTLKDIIEHIPSRDALPVCQMQHEIIPVPNKN